MKSEKTQRLAILNHLKEHGRITSLEAFNLFHITRLSAYIYDLREEGYNIESVRVKAINQFGHKCQYVEYVLGE